MFGRKRRNFDTHEHARTVLFCCSLWPAARVSLLVPREHRSLCIKLGLDTPHGHLPRRVALTGIGVGDCNRGSGIVRGVILQHREDTVKRALAGAGLLQLCRAGNAFIVTKCPLHGRKGKVGRIVDVDIRPEWNCGVGGDECLLAVVRLQGGGEGLRGFPLDFRSLPL